jgi:hypothetical protein
MDMVLTIEMGTTLSAAEGRATAMPVTADVIDTQGVKTPSAIVNAVPNRLW